MNYSFWLGEESYVFHTPLYFPASANFISLHKHELIPASLEGSVTNRGLQVTTGKSPSKAPDEYKQ